VVAAVAVEAKEGGEAESVKKDKALGVDLVAAEGLYAVDMEVGAVDLEESFVACVRRDTLGIQIRVGWRFRTISSYASKNLQTGIIKLELLLPA